MKEYQYEFIFRAPEGEEYYQDIDLQFNCNDSVPMEYLIRMFKAFASALTFEDETIKKFISTEKM